MSKARVDGIWVRLTEGEMLIGSMVGSIRQVQNIRDRRQDAYNLKKHGWFNHILGALGEQAVAKELNIFWSGSIGNLRASDVGGYEVRTRSSHWHDLILHKEDHDDREFILVTGNGSDYKFCMRGWMYGREAKQERYWADPSGDNRWAYFVAQAELRPIKTLPRR